MNYPKNFIFRLTFQAVVMRIVLGTYHVQIHAIIGVKDQQSRQQQHPNRQLVIMDGLHIMVTVIKHLIAHT